EVKDGGGLAQTLAATERFPNFALQMISLGEETGRLDEMLLEVAKTYDKKVQTTIERMLALLVPLLILGLASIIAFIVISILLALVSVSDFVM
ncbi:MAG: type II secretion system F family protein, partial [Gammaproteobacteria bacterium]